MKRILLSVLLISSVTIVRAQNFYVRAGVGYGFPHASQVAGASAVNGSSMAFINGSLNTGVRGTDFTIKKVSFGSGAQARVAAGYMFSKTIGIELEGSFGLSPTEHMLTVTSAGASYSTSYTQRAILPVMLTPAVLLQTGGEKLSAYTRFGVTMPVSAKIEDEVRTLYNDSAGSSLVTKSIQRPRFGLGLSAAAGVKYRLAKRLSVWAEASLLSMSLYAKESELTESSRNGVNNINLIPQGQRIYKYEFAGNTGNNAFYTYSMPFSSIAGCIGLSYDF